MITPWIIRRPNSNSYNASITSTGRPFQKK
jgi:hypothetical protein